MYFMMIVVDELLNMDMFYRQRQRKGLQSRRQRATQRGGYKQTKKRVNPPKPGNPICHPRIKSRRQGCLPETVKDQLQPWVGVCGKNERCLVSHSSLPVKQKQEILKKYFRPKMPKEWIHDPDMWLSSVDIEAVMKQYMEAKPEFHFLGVVPIDFSVKDPYNKSVQKCLQPQFCEIDIAGFKKKGVKYIGAVFNLDPHFKSGSHWISLFIHLPKNAAYFFDSYGVKPPEYVANFMRFLDKQLPGITLKYNERRFQHGNSECGMYSLYFLIRMMEGEPFEHFCHHAIDDKYMLEFRKILFDPTSD